MRAGEENQDSTRLSTGCFGGCMGWFGGGTRGGGREGSGWYWRKKGEKREGRWDDMAVTQELIAVQDACLAMPCF